MTTAVTYEHIFQLCHTGKEFLWVKVGIIKRNVHGWRFQISDNQIVDNGQAVTTKHVVE